MAMCTRLLLVCAVLSLTSQAAISQDKPQNDIEEQLQKRVDAIQKDLSDVREQLKLRIPRSKSGSFTDIYGIAGKPVSDVELLAPYTGGFQITAIEPGSYAEECGLKIGDVIIFGAPKTITLEEHVSVVQRLKSQNTRFPNGVFMHDGRLFATSRLVPLEKK